MSVGPCASFSAFQEVCLFIYRDLSYNSLAGTIPAQISTLVNLGSLCVLSSFYLVLIRAFQHFSFDECWLVRLSLTFSSFFCHRYLYSNALTGTIPSEISTLTNLGAIQNLGALYAPSLIKIIECWSCFFIECWPCAPLSHVFTVNLILL